MTFPTIVDINPPSLQVYNTFRDAGSLKNLYNTIISRVDSGVDVSTSEIMEWLEDMVSLHSHLSQSRGVPGLANMARHLLDDSSRNIEQEFTTMINTLFDLMRWIKNNIAVSSGDGYVKERKIENDGSFTNFTYTQAQLTQFRNNVNNALLTVQ